MNSLSEQVFETSVQFNVILVKVAVKLFCSENFSDTNKLGKRERKKKNDVWSFILFFLFKQHVDYFISKRHHRITWYYLVIIVLAVEKGFFLKNHTGQHAAQAPHV